MSEPKPTLAEMRATSYEGPDIITRMPKEMEENKMALLLFLSGTSEKLENHPGKYMPLVGFIAKRAVFPGKEGQPPKAGFFLGLVLEDGTILQSCSEVVGNSIDAFRTVMGEFPQAEPLWVRYEKVKAKQGFSHRLTPCPVDNIPESAVIIGQSEE